MAITAEEQRKLERLDAALKHCTETMGRRVPVRQVRLFCGLMYNPIPPRTVQELGNGVGAPASTVWTDMQRLGDIDRHGAPGLGMVTEVSNRIAMNTTFVINAKGYAAAQRLAACL